MSYASQTNVPVIQSQAEIERTISRYGAENFIFGKRNGKAVIGFELKTRAIKMSMDIPPRAVFFKDKKGKVLTENQAESKRAQRERALWRAMALIVKAKLEAVESGVATIEQEFLAYTVIPGGQTVAEAIQPRLQAWIDEGKVPQLLLAAGE